MTTPYYQLRLQVVLTVVGPFTTKSAAVGGYDVDAVLLRHDGLPLLPGSQVRGRLRDALTELAAADPSLTGQVASWFGPAVMRDDDQLQHGPRGEGWVFSDLLAEERFRSPDPYGRLLTRIRLDEATGSVAEGALLVAETAAEPGERVKFTGTIDLAARTKDDLVVAVDRLYRGLCWVPSLGSFRSVGFGRLDHVAAWPLRLCAWSAPDAEVEAARQAVQARLDQLQATTGSPPVALVARSAPVVVPLSAARYGLTVTVGSPFCVAETRTNRNLRRSVDHLGGAVLKGVVPAQLRFVLGLPADAELGAAGGGTAWAELCRHFDALRFCTAFPTDPATPGRPTVLPLSVFVGADKDQWCDAALADQPFVFRTKDGHLLSPAFDLDWKPGGAPDWPTGWKEPRREVRLHTAMDPGRRRVRKEHLFAQEVVRPEGVVWRGEVDLSLIPSADQPAVHAQLQWFLTLATPRVGKTKAPVCLELTGPVPVPSFAPLHGRYWVLTLLSPALLADPTTLRDQWQTANDDPLEAEYKRVWGKISGQPAGDRRRRTRSGYECGGHRRHRDQYRRGGVAQFRRPGCFLRFLGHDSPWGEWG
jgi:hypothetical protein